MAYECSSEQVKSFGFASRMMLEMLGCARGYKVKTHGTLVVSHLTLHLLPRYNMYKVFDVTNAENNCFDMLTCGVVSAM